jgi:hypothetical protein
MIWVVLTLFALLAAAVAALYVVTVKRAVQSVMQPVPEAEAKTKAEARAIVQAAEKEKQEVANASAETLLQRVRARVARALRK